MDRPPRKTKVVNYSEANAVDDDEDFAQAPPRKKAREEVKQEHMKSSSKSSSQESDSPSTQSPKSRRPLDVKLLERDLEAAITLSLLNNADGIKEQSDTSTGDVKVQVPVDENIDTTSLHLSNCSVLLDLDDITSERESAVLSRQRKAASKAAEAQKKTLADEDDDEEYKPKLTPDSESDEDFSEPAESDEEEFTVKKISKSKKEKVTKHEKTKPPSASKKEKLPSNPPKSKSPAAAVSTPVRSPPTAQAAPKRPPSSSTVFTAKPALPLSPAGGKIPKWTPPAQVGRGPSSSSPAVRSPGQGLRLGLSRHVRVKPLHPSLTTH
ncbi:RAD51-associated protein 1 isoform X1 [Trematomus bernacchii]|uniref:RAD51-associated protein 1 isoform X1 n=1 Tax=Trematomus bernacchii TaxID=40690 RepID=UPI00146F940E|nr:RAD51-associated protein 1 isoform X1 [Trematomus bernacchii]XP_033989165.1 RAD51-associated protein 1 isoform X1 [Trematomus bernacchii]XP_033989166.1 RAD51-associated protein 1 isoform X1 [Trematomus bernacchii]